MMIGGMSMSRWLVSTLKTRLTYPRTGYVEYEVNERNLKSRRIWVILLAFAVSSLTMIFVRLFQSFDSIVAVTGVAVGLILVILRAKSSGLDLCLKCFILSVLFFRQRIAKRAQLRLFMDRWACFMLGWGCGDIWRRILCRRTRSVRMAEDLRSVTELDRLIHEPARLLILTILSTVASADFLFLQRETGLTKGNLSAHLSKLEEAGYVKIEKTFKGKPLSQSIN
jgi:DNA-binding transcriptional ArsR family regulator